MSLSCSGTGSDLLLAPLAAAEGVPYELLVPICRDAMGAVQLARERDKRTMPDDD